MAKTFLTRFLDSRSDNLKSKIFSQRLIRLRRKNGWDYGKQNSHC